MALEIKENGHSIEKMDSIMCIDSYIREDVGFAFSQFGEEGVLYMIQESLRMLSVLKKAPVPADAEVYFGRISELDLSISETMSIIYSNDGYDGLLNFVFDVDCAHKYEPEHYPDQVNSLHCDAVEALGSVGVDHLKYEVHRAFSNFEQFQAITKTIPTENDSTTANRDRADQSID